MAIVGFVQHRVLGGLNKVLVRLERSLPLFQEIRG
jgi:hypothetical protein